ncbi:MAG: type II toxin-antitoxin system HicA family toxin [Acidobacteria bacterium]|nr:type II toxin-antitoxin system HicA family toxin [Acidobacteriota bacterium]
MPKLGPIKHKQLIKNLRQLGFDGPFAGGNHSYLKRGNLKVWIPNPHESNIGPHFLRKILKQAGISESEWEAL